MADELEANFAEAAEAGGTPQSFIGDDVAGFARTWAEARNDVRPRWRVVSTTLVAGVSTLPAVAFAAVLPLLGTSEWGLELLVSTFPSQRRRTNLDCLHDRVAGQRCPSVNWDAPTWVLVAWYAVAVAVALAGAIIGSSAWLRHRRDPARGRTRTALLISLPTLALGWGAFLAIYDKSGDSHLPNNSWVLLLIIGVALVIAGTRFVVVANSRGFGLQGAIR